MRKMAAGETDWSDWVVVHGFWHITGGLVIWYLYDLDYKLFKKKENEERLKLIKEGGLKGDFLEKKLVVEKKKDKVLAVNDLKEEKTPSKREVRKRACKL